MGRRVVRCENLNKPIFEDQCPDKTCSRCKLASKKSKKPIPRDKPRSPERVEPKTFIPMKFSLEDKYEALRRSEVYEKEYVRVMETPDSDDLYKELCKKYKIPNLPPPLFIEMKREKKKITLDFSKQRRMKQQASVEVVLPPPQDHSGAEFFDVLIGATVPDVAYLQAGRFLYLRVDLAAGLPQLTETFENTVREWREKFTEERPEHNKEKEGSWVDSFEESLEEAREEIRKELTKQMEGRMGKTSADPWHVYDLHVFDGKSLLKIAKERIGINKNPTSNPQVKAEYGQVTGAFNKAKKMIKIVEAYRK